MNLAGWWRGLAGYLIDGLVVSAATRLLGAGGALALALSAVYWVAWLGSAGHATVGMRAVGVRVVPADSRPTVTYLDAFTRWLMMTVAALALGLGFLWAAWDPHRQTWQDRVARTLVVPV